MALIATIMITGCSKDEIVEQRKGERIGFHVQSQNSVITRGTAVTPSNVKTAAPDFGVWGFKNLDKSQYVGSSNTSGIKIKWDGANNQWDYVNPSDLSYWPTDALDFYAINPFSDASITNVDITGTSQAFDYQVSTTNASQVDLMYASKLNLSKPGDATVGLFFKHALSQIIFKGKVASTDLTVEVESIVVNNLVGQGTFTFPSAETASGSASGSWALGSVKGLDFPVGMSTTTTVNSTSSATDLTAANGALLILPQTPTPWTTTIGAPVSLATANAPDSEQTYLRISCKIQQGSTYLVGNSGTYASIYVPFGEAWAPGKKYIYTLIFGGGYDADGKPVLEPIKYNVTVEAWADTSSDLAL